MECSFIYVRMLYLINTAAHYRAIEFHINQICVCKYAMNLSGNFFQFLYFGLNSHTDKISKTNNKYSDSYFFRNHCMYCRKVLI